ncbi:UNVERIFIED_CONTAM: hypothetical protein Sangu_3192600, partial [Sesamum angustifolium]
KMFKNPLTLIMETNKFNGTNYNDWLKNLMIVQNFENQRYIVDKLLPKALPEGSSPEKHVAFEKWLEVHSIILASMTSDIQKQYDRVDDIPSIMLRMKEVYAVLDTNIRYAATKAFFGTKRAEGSSVLSHGIHSNTYIDVILQSLSPSYDPFIINYNMNGLEKSIHDYGAHICNNLQVLERSRKLNKDEIIMRLGDGKMKYKSEAFARFKEYKLQVENHTGHKIKALRLDQGGEYLSGEFIDYLKENGILSQWIPPGTPQLNGVAQRRNRTV